MPDCLNPPKGFFRSSEVPVRGVSGAHLMIIVEPDARLAPILAAVRKSGTFQGTIPPQMPTGAFATRTGPRKPGGSCSNGNVPSSSANPSSTAVAARRCRAARTCSALHLGGDGLGELLGAGL